MSRMRVNFFFTIAMITGIYGCAETPTMDEFSGLKQSQEKMQKELDEVKAWIAKHTPPKPKPFTPSLVTISGSPYLGKADAPVTLVEFTDYQCPFCKRHATVTLPQIVKEYVDTGILRYVLRDFPLQQIHPNAVKLAEAVQCANDQGKGWEMHDRIFGAGKSPDPAKLSKDVKAVGLDAKAFSACLKSNKYAEKIEASVKEGMQLGVRGTPGFFLGKTDVSDPDKVLATERIIGAQPFAAFKRSIDKILNDKETEKEVK